MGAGRAEKKLIYEENAPRRGGKAKPFHCNMIVKVLLPSPILNIQAVF